MTFKNVTNWLTVEFAVAIHAEQLREHGGGEGIRDHGLLESALNRPQQLANDSNPNVFDIAAAYAFGLAKNHPFIDGNKRTAWVLARTHCLLNGFDFIGSDGEAVLTTLRLAAGDLDQDAFAKFLMENSAAI